MNLYAASCQLNKFIMLLVATGYAFSSEFALPINPVSLFPSLTLTKHVRSRIFRAHKSFSIEDDLYKVKRGVAGLNVYRSLTHPLGYYKGALIGTLWIGIRIFSCDSHVCVIIRFHFRNNPLYFHDSMATFPIFIGQHTDVFVIQPVLDQRMNVGCGVQQPTSPPILCTSSSQYYPLLQ